MCSETRNNFKGRAGCAELGQMHTNFNNMMKMMDKCCPDIKENICDRDSLSSMMDKCCGTMANQPETSDAEEKEPKRSTKIKEETCCRS
jgi:hypothetical protein